jgi:hypothetical protein
MLSPYAEQAVLLAGGVGYGGSVSYYLGRLAVALGWDSDAAAHYARAVEVDSAMGARPAVARALRQWGRYSGDAALVARAAQLMADMGVTPPATDRPAAAAVTAVLRANGDGFVVGWDGQSRRLPSLRGLAYLARLVSQPGREVHVLDLTARPAGDSGTVLDDRAKEAYRRRLTDLQTDLEEAESRADTGQAERARAEIDALIDQLSAAVGLGGRDRRLGSEAERARTSVRRAVKTALDRVSVELPGLGHHLTRSVVTGTYCCYRPDERLPVDWQT